MLHIGSTTSRNCEGWTRRHILQVGGLGMLGLSLPDWLRSRAQANPGSAASSRDSSCILIWLSGGPSHFETFDPKPNTPDDVRGPYGAIDTSAPGIRISELMPLVARHMNKSALIRSMNHGNGGHSTKPMLTAFQNSSTTYGAVLTRIKGHSRAMPPYVHIGSRLDVGGGDLGVTYNPVEVADPTGSKLQLPQLSLSADISADRFQQRRELLQAIDQMREKLDSNLAVEKMDTFYQRAIEMLTSPRVREAFDLSHEKETLRNRFGANRFGQSCLLARRLVEAGTRFVQIKWYDSIAFDAWDLHGAEMAGLSRMEQQLCPRLDLGLSALLEDLDQRGLLRSTIVIAMGEFGRTPKINRFGGRDHWPRCFSVFLAGGGIPGGTVVGASDAQGGYPAHTPVSPPELAATLYRLLGIDTNTDPRIRPFIGNALPLADLV